MCVIVLKPAGVELEEADVRAMFRKNPHGMGFSYFLQDGLVRIDKGYMSEDLAVEALKPFKDVTIVAHFRLTTHGVTCPAQCHPFAISEDVTEAKTRDTASGVLFHNGVISGYGDDKVSDTINFTCRVLSKIPNIEVRKKVLGLTRDRFALLQDGRIILVGDFKDHKGLVCSNLNFVQSQHCVYSGYGVYGNNYAEGAIVGPLRFPAKTKEELERDAADKEKIEAWQKEMDARRREKEEQEELERRILIAT